MGTAIRYIRYDFRITWRESSTRLFLFMPLVFFSLLHWGMPMLLEAYPVVAAWAPLLLGGIVFQGGLMFAFVAGFLLLDEKDLNLMTVYRVAPVPFWKLLVLKMSFPFVATWVYALACLGFNPVLRLEGIAWVVTAFHFALITPAGALLVAGLGKNKVEGLTWFKLIDLILIAPFMAFFLPAPWPGLFWIFPTYGVFDSLMAWADKDWNAFWRDQGIGLTQITALLVVARWLFQRRS